MNNQSLDYYDLNYQQQLTQQHQYPYHNLHYHHPFHHQHPHQQQHPQSSQYHQEQPHLASSANDNGLVMIFYPFDNYQNQLQHQQQQHEQQQPQHHNDHQHSSHQYLQQQHQQQQINDPMVINDIQLFNSEIIELLGPVRDPLSTVIPMSILYCLILITGTIGNVCTCIVIARNRYMHTATNFYLFSLAISDLLLLILGLPQELFMLWQKYPYIFGEFFCLVRGLSSETSTNASILTITAFTIERYVAICHPLKSHTMSQLPRAIKTILIIWAVSAICALPVAWQFGIIFMINKSSFRNISRQCGIKNVYFEYGFETTAIVFFLVPITLITILYVLIGINLRRSAQKINMATIKMEQHNQQHHHQQLSKMAQNDPDYYSNTNISNSNSNNNLNHQTTTTTSRMGRHFSESECQINLYYQRNNSISSSNQKQIASRRSVIRMLVAVVISFFFCYSPFHAQRVLATMMHRYQINSPTIHTLYIVLTHISGVTYYLSATINPILYQVMSRKFRLAFSDTFSSCSSCLRNDIPEITYLSIVGGGGGAAAGAAGAGAGTGSSIGAGHHSFSRIPSFTSNCSFRYNENYSDRQRQNSIRMIHSFDPIIDPTTTTTTTGSAMAQSPDYNQHKTATTATTPTTSAKDEKRKNSVGFDFGNLSTEDESHDDDDDDSSTIQIRFGSDDENNEQNQRQNQQQRQRQRLEEEQNKKRFRQFLDVPKF